jgi:hypothetical protein
MLNVVCRVLMCQGPSVVPGYDGRFHTFFLKSVKEIHSYLALRHIGASGCFWGSCDGNNNVVWRCRIHPQIYHIHGAHSRCHPLRWCLSRAHPLSRIPGKAC